MADIQNMRLEMGGGEFCANAARAFGALLDMKLNQPTPIKPRHYNIHVSGNSYPVALNVAGSVPQWKIGATFHLGNFSLSRLSEKQYLVHVPGITHLLLGDDWPSYSGISEMARKLRKSYKLDQYPASGVVWWRKTDNALEILPHVEVPAAGTSMLETACGSASIALALALREGSGEQRYQILQPGGEILQISLDPAGKSATLTGTVKLCACGDLWLADNH